MTAFLWSKGTRQTWYARLEQHYDRIEETCLIAMRKIRRGDVTAFAAFAKNIGLLGGIFQNQARHTAGIRKKEYQEWERAYKMLPLKTRKQTEADLPF